MCLLFLLHRLTFDNLLKNLLFGIVTSPVLSIGEAEECIKQIAFADFDTNSSAMKHLILVTGEK